MYNINKFKYLPKIEVSFQDDFSGSLREYTLTPRYVLRELEKSEVKPKIGDKVLLWEKDLGADGHEYYLCNIGKIKILKKNLSKIDIDDLTCINGKPILIEIDKKGYFSLPFDSSLFG